MTSSTDMVGQTESFMQTLAEHWGLVLVMGILSIVLGVLAIMWPGATLLTIAIFFAAWLFVSGLFSIIQSFTRDGDTGARVLHALIGILSVIVGFALLRTPFQALEVLIFVLGVFWVAQGIVTFMSAFSSKQGRNWRLFTGILGVIAGIIVLVYPISSAAVLALFGGIWLVILGITQIIAAFQLRSAAKAPVAPSTPAPSTPAAA